jgi:hypothetical protein
VNQFKGYKPAGSEGARLGAPEPNVTDARKHHQGQRQQRQQGNLRGQAQIQGGIRQGQGDQDELDEGGQLARQGGMDVQAAGETPVSRRPGDDDQVAQRHAQGEIHRQDAIPGEHEQG